jgi:glycerol-3-phosphate dehydrogenase
MHADVVVVGGGIQGATMALAAHHKGLRPVLIERSTIAAGATGNSYGIIHGGLRYLQTFDIARWRQSRRAQSWFLENYPGFVRPLPCVMPLYKGCLRSPLAFRAASAFESALFTMLGSEPPLPRLRLVSTDEVTATYPVPRQSLNGAALWHDLQINDIDQLMTTMLSDAGLMGGQLLTNTEALSLRLSDGRVSGLRVRNVASGTESIVESDVVINCSGSWANQWNDANSGPSAASLAFNLLLDIPFPGEAALAVSERPGRGRSYFLRPHQGSTFAGTWYRPAPGMREPEPDKTDIRDFLQALDRAMPGLGLVDARVLRVMPGLLPDTDGTGTSLSSCDTAVIGQPQGFHTVVGGKLTTAPLLSFDVADRLWPQPVVQKRAA